MNCNTGTELNSVQGFENKNDTLQINQIKSRAYDFWKVIVAKNEYLGSA